MRRELILLGVALAGGGLTGWVTAPPTQVQAMPSQLAAPAPVNGGETAMASRQRLMELSVASGFTANVEAPAAPPPPDVALLFRRDLTAIEQRPGGTIVWIVDFTRDFGRRGMRVGDVYQDGWRLAAVSPQWIELRRRREVRRVAVFEPPPNLEP